MPSGVGVPPAPPVAENTAPYDVVPPAPPLPPAAPAVPPAPIVTVTAVGAVMTRLA
jgi:hypothetical protein